MTRESVPTTDLSLFDELVQFGQQLGDLRVSGHDVTDPRPAGEREDKSGVMGPGLL